MFAPGIDCQKMVSSREMAIAIDDPSERATNPLSKQIQEKEIQEKEAAPFFVISNADSQES
jgi:hypothetical protein